MVGEAVSTKTVLVVEDERPLAAAITKKLQITGFETALVNSVEDALEHMKTKHIDAIWLDHYLFGETNGIDFVKIIKADAKWRRIPVYIVSNTAGDDKVKTYLELGIKNYYVKSNHRLDEIIKAIQAGLTRRK